MFDEFDLKFLLSIFIELVHWGDYGTAMVLLILISIFLIRRNK